MSDEKEPKNNDEKNDQNKDDDVRKDLDDILGRISESGEGKKEQKKEEPAEEKPEKSEPETPEQPSKEQPAQEAEGLDEILGRISEKEEEPPSEDMGVFQRMIGIFTNPSKVFEHLRFKPDYLVPLIVIIIISTAITAVVYDIAIQDQINKIEENENIPPEQKNTIIDNIAESRYGVRRIIYSYVFPGVGVLVTFSIVSAIFLFIGNVLLGGKARFVHLFSTYTYAYLIIGVVGSIVKLPLWLSQQTLQVDFSPAIFMPSAETGTTLYNFISSFDIFTLWFLVVFGIGFSIIYRFSQLKGILSVFIAWLIYILVTKVALGSIFSTITG